MNDSSPLETRGRRIAIGIALWLNIPTVLALVVLPFASRATTANQWTSFVLNASWRFGLSWLLYRAIRWTRIYLAVSMFLSALIPFLAVGRIVQAIASGRVPLGAISLALLLVLVSVGVNLALAVVLWRSPALIAYFDRENEIPTLNLRV